MRTALLLLLTLALPGAAQPPDATPASDDLEKLAGNWTLVTLELNGNRAPEEAAARYRLLVQGDRWVMERDERPAVTWKVRRPMSVDPRALDLIGTVQGQDLLYPAIYHLEGDTLTVCRASVPGKPRPTEFRTTAGEVLAVWKRM